MNILIISNNDGGLALFRCELISELMQNNNVTLGFEFGNRTYKLNQLGGRCINIPIDRRGINPLKDFSLYCNYVRILKAEKPDMVITYTIKPNIYCGFACRLKKIPYAANITGLGTAFQGNGILRKLVSFMYKVSLKKARKVFFENSGNMQIFRDEKIISEKQACLLNGAGVSLEYFSLLDYPSDNEITRFLFIGRVMKEKGIDELFSVMKRLVSEGVKCSLAVVGEYEENYAETIKKYENEGWLYYYGHQMDVRPFIEKCHCFVLPSWHEGMANTNLECAASGRPVITSDIAGCKESVIDGESGFLVEKHDTESLYNAMKRFSEISCDNRKNMGLCGRKHMEEVFDKKKVVKATCSAIFGTGD